MLENMAATLQQFCLAFFVYEYEYRMIATHPQLEAQELLQNDFPSILYAQVQGCLVNGHKLDAIKLVRDRYSIDLRTAKIVVDSIGRGPYGEW